MDEKLVFTFTVGYVALDCRATMERIFTSIKLMYSHDECRENPDKLVIEMAPWLFEELRAYWRKVSTNQGVGERIFGVRLKVVEELPTDAHWCVKLSDSEL